MPLYEYECQQCHRHTEKRQKFSDPEITECPHCGGPLERVISAPAISFKGGGWYADGYGNAKPKSSSGEQSSGDGAKSGDSAAKPADGTAKPASTGESSTPAPAPSAAPSTPAPSSTPAKP